MDRENSEVLLAELTDFLNKVQDIPFPDYLSLKENSEKIYGNLEN